MTHIPYSLLFLNGTQTQIESQEIKENVFRQEGYLGKYTCGLTLLQMVKFNFFFASYVCTKYFLFLYVKCITCLSDTYAFKK